MSSLTYPQYTSTLIHMKNISNNTSTRSLQRKNPNSPLLKLLESYEKGQITEETLLSVLLTNTKKSEMKELLTSLFTKDERHMFAHRLLIIKMLKDNISQHEISKKLKVGVLTVTRGAREIEKGRFNFI